MPRKWTDEQKRAFAEDMKRRREAKAGNKSSPAPKTEESPAVHGLSTESSEQPQAEPVSEVSPSAPEDVQGETELDQLKRQVQELKDMLFFQRQAPPVSQGPQVTSQGVRGTVIKFALDPKHYPSPVDRLFSERMLTIQGFSRDWYDVEWEVGRVNYPTKDGINVTEPKFQVRLVKIIPDEEGMPSKKRFILHKMTFFEDPDAAIQVAQAYGIEVAEDLQKDFLDEMRYLRVRDWVRESFYPAKPIQKRANQTEQVIGNRLVKVFEANSEEPTSIPFDQMKK